MKRWFRKNIAPSYIIMYLSIMCYAGIWSSKVWAQDAYKKDKSKKKYSDYRGRDIHLWRFHVSK
jgi:hypothetical protein